MINLNPKWDVHKRRNESELLDELIEFVALDTDERQSIVDHGASLVEMIRNESKPSLMDVFLAEYGLSNDEGVALMCLAEALLRVPDAGTIDALIEDKVAASDWSKHIGQSSSPLVNASTWGLLLTGKVLGKSELSVTPTLRQLLKRLGEPVVRKAVAQAMREMGRQFVLGEAIKPAMKRAENKEQEGFTYSYDMLGEAAMTMLDARRYQQAYSKAISAIAKGCHSQDIGANPGISVKLSALHPRYEVAKTDRVMSELLPSLMVLVHQAAAANMGFNIDAEEADRLGLSMTLIEAVLAEPSLAGWDGFGVVVQAYGRRAADVIDGLYEMAARYDRKIMVRLVKGAYWDSEIKQAQVNGLDDFPVFTHKAATDISYLANARKLLGMTDRIYPQFATHNAHSVAAILNMAKGVDLSAFEFQRLHGMGEALHDIVHKQAHTQCRIYAPVGAHRDLLAYLVRRLLENGANSSFVNQIVDHNVPAKQVAACPLNTIAKNKTGDNQPLPTGPNLFAPLRENSRGFDLADVSQLQQLEKLRQIPKPWRVEPLLAKPFTATKPLSLFNPATGAAIGEVVQANVKDVNIAFESAQKWDIPVAERAKILRKAAALYEQHFAEIFALLATEAGKTLADSVAELREAVDFLYYYAAEGMNLENHARGTFVCISPWNFPLAIFTGQIAAALAAGNAVLAKPAEETPAIAAWGATLLHKAGVPKSALQLLPGEGPVIGKALVADPRVNGIAFTGSTNTARQIQHTMAKHAEPGTPLIAETGGINAMIVDSTALPEQVVRDIIASAFQSAGQRCSALRCLYVQEDIEPVIREMLTGAMEELQLGDSWLLSTDIGPVISAQAKTEFTRYVAVAASEGRFIYQIKSPSMGYFMPPTLLKVGGIKDIKKEMFGPILHMATFKTGQVKEVIDAVNATGYGLTFGLHTRIDGRVQQIADTVHAGNIYANRNQIGAIVGSQPFGGEGLSGTGPKAGGPHYLTRLTRHFKQQSDAAPTGQVDLVVLADEIKAKTYSGAPTESEVLPGPTGELNRLSAIPRPPLLCLGPGKELAAEQKKAVELLGGIGIAIPHYLSPQELQKLPMFSALLWWGNNETARELAIALSTLEGPLIPLITDMPDKAHTHYERHLCVDTTAAGGNVSLLAGE